jgi:hypothetical protein
MKAESQVGHKRDRLRWISMRGIAFWLKGYATHIVEYGDGFEEEETDYSFVKAVMVGDNREHIIDVDDLTLLDENDYCHVCGQVGCQHDGLDRD